MGCSRVPPKAQVNLKGIEIGCEGSCNMRMHERTRGKKRYLKGVGIGLCVMLQMENADSSHADSVVNRIAPRTIMAREVADRGTAEGKSDLPSRTSLSAAAHPFRAR